MSAQDVPQSDRVHVNLDPAAAIAAYTHHRRRFAEEVASLDSASLSTQSRCSEWSVADILRHGADVDEWMWSIWSGEPLPFDSFDPRTTPHEYVVAGRSLTDEAVRDRYVESTERMAADVENSGAERWGAAAISPLGFVPWWLSVLHIFWDSWMHERDALLPLGLDVPVRIEESEVVLAYALAVAGTFVSEPTDVVVGGVRLVTGDGPVQVTPVEARRDIAPVVDALSGRATLDETVDLSPDVVRQLTRLARGLQPA